MARVRIVPFKCEECGGEFAATAACLSCSCQGGSLGISGLRGWAPGAPRMRQFVHALSVEDGEDPHLLLHDPVHHPIVPHAKLPVALERSAQRFAVALGGGGEAGL